MLLKCFLIQVSMIIARLFLYRLYLCPCPHLGLFMSYLCHLVSTSILIIINHSNLINLSWRSVLLYRSQFINLGSRSMDWFLYDRALRHETVEAHLLICTLEYTLSFWDHSVHWGINPLLKNTTPSFLSTPPPPLNRQTSSPSPLGNPPLYIGFSWTHPSPLKVGFFGEPPKY